MADETFQKLCDTYDTTSVVTVTDPDVIPAGLLDPTIQDVFPEDIVIVQWQPYNVTLASNVRYIMRTSQCNITYSRDQVVAATFLSTVMCQNSTLKFHMEIYVSSSLADDQQWFYFKQHILKGLQYKWPTLSKSPKALLLVFYPKRLDIAETRSWLAEHFPAITPSQRKRHTEADPHYLACEYDKTKLI